MPIDLILGTAGHIDHGKTSLVKALTGVDTDRLPEEKKRGITIELGFAELVLGDVRLGIVDVPGHERFVRNMLAGATGIDVAMLVVAADDSVKPQTREHLDILKLLHLEEGVIALTKCDLPEPSWIDLVEEEIRELVSDCFLAKAPIVRCSAHTGAGLEELRAALSAAAHRVSPIALRRREGPFRLAIDRSFTIAGHGTVVTGSVASGRAAMGDELVVEPGSIAVRIRGVEQHDRTVEEVHRGQRAAINLAGIHHEQIGRGQELASAGFLVPSRLLSVRLNLLPSTPRPLRTRSRVRLHVGTAEIMASVVLIDRDELAPGESSFAQIFLATPAVTTWNQPYVLRSESPVITIGGGNVVDPHAVKIRRGDAGRSGYLARLESRDELERASGALYLLGLRPWKPTDLVRMAGVANPEAVAASLAERGEIVSCALSPSKNVLIHRQTLEDVATRIESALAKLHEQYPLVAMLDRSRLTSRLEYIGSDAIVDAVLARLAAAGRIRLSDRGVALAGRGPQLSTGEQRLVDEILARYRTAAFQPPTVAEIQKTTAKNQGVVPQLVKLAASQGQLVEVSPEFYLHADVEASLRQRLVDEMGAGKGLTISQIRELLGTSRKYAVPFCEYLDRIGFTRRDGDVRFLAAGAVVT
ncbi:MAG: selenocysteine-specific translation elongation factor [Pirellulales bacterium]